MNIFFQLVNNLIPSTCIFFAINMQYVRLAIYAKKIIISLNYVLQHHSHESSCFDLQQKTKSIVNFSGLLTSA